MKVIQNIPAIIKILMSLPGLRKIKKKIDDAKEAGDNKAEKEAILAATNMWGNQLLKSFKINLKIEGEENIPNKGPVVYVSNHQGFADIPVLCAILNKIQFGFIAKDGLKQIPFYGTWMQRIRSVMIKRNDSRASLKAISEGIENIKNGFSILVFPEGTRARGGPMNEFKRGALKLATKPRVPIIPISINGTYKILEETGIIKSAPVDVIIHPAIETSDISRTEEQELTDKVFNIIHNGVIKLKEKQL